MKNKKYTINKVYARNQPNSLFHFLLSPVTRYRLHVTGPSSRGAALTLSVLFFVIISLAIVMGSVNPVVRDFNTGQELIQSKLSYFTAEAGGEDAFYRLKSGKLISSPEVTTLNGGSSSVTIVNVGSNEKEITSNSTISSNVRNMKVSLITGVGSDFSYGAQVGEGGLVMGNNSSIEGVGGTVGNVYSNGPIVGSPNSAITGSATVATTVAEDNQARSTVCNADQDVARTSPEIDFAQSFSPGESKPLYKVSLYIKKVGNPGSRTIRIVADDGTGVPNTTTLASATLQESLVTGTFGWVDVTFGTPANLIIGQKYWIILDDNGANASHYWVWCKDSNNGFGNGEAKYRANWDSGAPWSSPITGDLTFKTYLGAGPGTISGVTSVGIDAYANTINNTNAGGNLYCQTGSGNNKVCNTSRPDPSPLNMPISDGNIAQWKDDATAGGTINGNCGDSGDPSCTTTSGSTLSLGPKKINGNLTLTNSRTLNLTGVVYVTGTVNISNLSKIKCDVSFGAESCVMVVDGSVTVSNNGDVTGSGQAGSYVLMVSTIVGCNGSGGTGCASGSSGIDLGNNLTGGIFYTTKSMINISNGVEIKAVVGYKLNLAPTAIIKYEQGVADTTFASGPGGGWNVKSWKEAE